MARIRTIKPEFWTSEQIVDCSPNARLLFIGLWNFCDDYGVHPAKVVSLKMQVFPADPFTKEEMGAMIDELKAAGLLVEYEIENEAFWYVTGWDRHQKTDQKTGKWPRPDGKIGKRIRRSFGDHSANNQRKDTEHSPPEKEKDKEKEKDNKYIEREKAILKKSKNGTATKTPPPVAATPSPGEAAYAWAVDNLDFLKGAKEKSGFSGKVKDEVIKFTAHYADNDDFEKSPVKFFKNKFAGWLVTAESKSKRPAKSRKQHGLHPAEQVTREKVIEHISNAHGAFQAEFLERDISALIQCKDMTDMRERCAEILKAKMNDTNFKPARQGETALAGLVGQIVGTA